MTTADAALWQATNLNPILMTPRLEFCSCSPLRELACFSRPWSRIHKVSTMRTLFAEPYAAGNAGMYKRSLAANATIIVQARVASYRVNDLGWTHSIYAIIINFKPPFFFFDRIGKKIKINFDTPRPCFSWERFCVNSRSTLFSKSNGTLYLNVGFVVHPDAVRIG